MEIRISSQTLLIIMLYVTAKITCDPLFFRQIELMIPILDIKFKVTGSVLIYPLTYICCDLLSLKLARREMLMLILMGAFCDGLFSFLIKLISTFAIPNMMSQIELAYLNAINLMAPKMWSLYYHGVIASIIATISELFLFKTLFKKIKSIKLSIFISVSTILIIHNVVSNYPVMKHVPNAIFLVLYSTFCEIFFLFIYIMLIDLYTKIKCYIILKNF